MRVLIADDHIGVRSAIRRVLVERIRDSAVVEAANLGELFARSFRQQPNLVLLDWELSGLPSAATMSLAANDAKRRHSELRRNVVLFGLHNLTSHPWIIVLSSHPEARQSALFVGADAFVLKGGAPQELFDALHSFTRIKKNHPQKGLGRPK
ncbi:MAG: response regulator [Chloroflexota bacterium]